MPSDKQLIIPIILAGGTGTRLWPLSRTAHPKQTQSVLGKETLLAATLKRVRALGKQVPVWIATSADHGEEVRALAGKQSSIHLSVEPERRGTAAALGLALLRVQQQYPEAIVVTSNADNWIGDTPAYVQAVKAAQTYLAAHPEAMVLIGVRPTAPETGYGYIVCGDRLPKSMAPHGAREVYRIARFVEKPHREAAMKLLTGGNAFWNATIVVAHVGTLRDAFTRHLPAHDAGWQKVQAMLGTKEEEKTIARVFKTLPAVSLDVGILEKEQGMVMIPAPFPWSDVGTWRSVKTVIGAQQKTSDLVTRGKVVCVDTKKSLILSEGGRLVATLGLENIVVIDTPDAVLIAAADRDQDVRDVVKQIQKKGYRSVL